MRTGAALMPSALGQFPDPFRPGAGLARAPAPRTSQVDQSGRPPALVRRQLGIMSPGRPVRAGKFKLTPTQAFQCRFQVCTAGTTQKCVSQGPDAVRCHLLPCVRQVPAQLSRLCQFAFEHGDRLGQLIRPAATFASRSRSASEALPSVDAAISSSASISRATSPSRRFSIALRSRNAPRLCRVRQPSVQSACRWKPQTRWNSLAMPATVPSPLS
jgi:hypothetical protein